MATFTRAEDLARHQRERAKRVQRSMELGSQEVAESAKRHASLLVSGFISTKDLARLDHPFARRHGSARLPVLPINMQSGRLRNSLRVFKRKTGDVTMWRLQFMAPYAKFVLSPTGTKRMLPRNFWNALRLHVERVNTPTMRRFLRNAQRR